MITHAVAKSFLEGFCLGKPQTSRQ